LPPAALKRLANLAGAQAPSQEALAFLVAGDLQKALSLERRSKELWSEPWAPYLTAKARVMTSRRRLVEAQEALDLVHSSWWRRPAYWLARFDVSQASGRLGDVAKAEAKLRSFARRTWIATDWTWRQGRARLEMLNEEPARGIELGFLEIPDTGAVIELRLAGAILGNFPVTPGQSLVLNVELAPALHVLELETVGGGRVLPGAVRLR